MKRILVPLDGSELSERVLRHAEILAKRSNAAVILLRVVPFSWPNEFIHVREMGDKLDKEASDYLFAISAKLGEKGIEGECCVQEGGIPEVICDFAREREVDLIAMSTHGRGGLKRWALGSVTDKVIQTSSVPVLLCRITEERVASSSYKNVLIPVDASPFSENIFPQARSLIELFNARVWFLYVIDAHLIESFAVLKQDMIKREKMLMDNIRSYFSDLEKRLKEVQATNYEIVIENGDPAGTICDFAKENAMDLIAMSTHGRSGVARWALGSVTDKVVQYSSKPVLLIRAAERGKGA
jgi:nucleotide-binding universal stress UspA family protein